MPPKRPLSPAPSSSPSSSAAPATTNKSLYHKIIKIISDMFILTVSGVLQINNALKSYLTSLYFKNNNPIILILALPFICDFNLLFI